MIPEKKQDRHKRIIYTRLLERFVNKCVNFINTKEESTKKEFDAFILSIKSTIEKAETVPLHNEYFSELEKFVTFLINIPESNHEMDELKNNILRDANRLRKIQRQKTFKKDKHKKQPFDDEF